MGVGIGVGAGVGVGMGVAVGTCVGVGVGTGRGVAVGVGRSGDMDAGEAVGTLTEWMGEAVGARVGMGVAVDTLPLPVSPPPPAHPANTARVTMPTEASAISLGRIMESSLWSASMARYMT